MRIVVALDDMPMLISLTAHAHINMIYCDTQACRDNKIANFNDAYIMYVGQCGMVNKARISHMYKQGTLDFIAHMSHLVHTVT